MIVKERPDVGEAHHVDVIDGGGIQCILVRSVRAFGFGFGTTMRCCDRIISSQLQHHLGNSGLVPLICCSSYMKKP